MEELDFLRNKLESCGALDEPSVLAIEAIDGKLLLYQKIEETLYNSDLYFVYVHTTPDGRMYIGITKNLPNSRWNEGAGYEGQKKFYKAIQAYGWMNIEHRIIAAGLSEIEAKTLETELILKHKTYDAKYGYNSNLSVAELKKSDRNAGVKANKKAEVDAKEIAGQLVEKYTIKTIDGHIYYLSDGEYVKEANNPIISKELLLNYNLPPQKHREIIQIIKIISFANKRDIFPNGSSKDSSKNAVREFVENLAFDAHNDYFISHEEVYKEYLLWTKNNSIVPLEKTKLVPKAAEHIRNYRPDLTHIASSQKQGWEMRQIAISSNGNACLTARGMDMINAWLDETSEPCICVAMVWNKVFQRTDKCPKSISNGIGDTIRERGWIVAPSPKRFLEYGMQRYFTRY